MLGHQATLILQARGGGRPLSQDAMLHRTKVDIADFEDHFRW
jgi:hypothetical protein